MAKWLKLYATYTFSTSPNLCQKCSFFSETRCSYLCQEGHVIDHKCLLVYVQFQ